MECCLSGQPGWLASEVGSKWNEVASLLCSLSIHVLLNISCSPPPSWSHNVSKAKQKSKERRGLLLCTDKKMRWSSPWRPKSQTLRLNCDGNLLSVRPFTTCRNTIFGLKKQREKAEWLDGFASDCSSWSFIIHPWYYQLLWFFFQESCNI